MEIKVNTQKCKWADGDMGKDCGFFIDELVWDGEITLSQKRVYSVIKIVNYTPRVSKLVEYLARYK